ncbi:hypothetical protein [Streptomyces sp. NPDC048825]|uniref:hypothetical protein n=1 Tax=Streptomyces sp. NPDC048825 TaxID=3365592 RepID=UPI003717CC77
MVKNRITPTFDPGENAANHEAVADYGLDLSAFLRIAALAEAARVRRAQGRFAEVDAVSRAAEESTPDIPPDAAPGGRCRHGRLPDAIDTDIGS